MHDVIPTANPLRHVEVRLTKAVGIRGDTRDGEPALQRERKRMPAAILKASQMRDRIWSWMSNTIARARR